MAQEAHIKPDDFEARYEQANDLYRAKDYDAAFQQLLPLARAGYAKAQDLVGYLFRKGWGVEQDFSRAFLWLSRAADQGVAISITQLGIMFDEGESVPKSYRRSHALYLEAAEKGSISAMMKAAEDYLGGWGTYKDRLRALEWYTKARDAGRQSASEKVAEVEALIYEPKVEIPEGMTAEQFVADLEQRARDKDVDASFKLALCERDGIGTEKQMQFFLEQAVIAIKMESSDAMDMARRLGSEVFARYAFGYYHAKRYMWAWHFADVAAALGNPDGNFVKGVLKYLGHEVKKDEAAGIEYLRKGAEKDSARACLFYGRVFLYGEEDERDDAEGMRWLCRAAILGEEESAKQVMERIKKGEYELEPGQAGVYETAARAGDGEARRRLALEYERSSDDSFRDICKAALWFERGVAAGDKDADDCLSRVYASDQWNDDDTLLPPARYGKAAEDGCGFAIQHLAEAYLEGVGVEQDKAKAARLFVKAGNAGLGEGFYRAACLYSEGDGVRKDPAWAVSLLRKGAELKNADAQYALGCAYRDGIGVSRDVLKAVDCFFDAAEQGYVKALAADAYLVEVYHKPEVAREHAEMAAQLGDSAAKLLIAQKKLVGSAYDVDAQDARRRFEELAAEDCGLACYANLFLGVMYLKGLGVEADLSKSVELLVLAADQGSPAAAQILDDLHLAEGEAIKERYQKEFEKHYRDQKYMDRVREELSHRLIPSVDEGWSKRASDLAAERPDHANYELLLDRVYELGENRYDAEKRRAMLYEYGYVKVMQEKTQRNRHGSWRFDGATGAEVMSFLRSRGLVK